jgi:hypothetical protein
VLQEFNQGGYFMKNIFKATLPLLFASVCLAQSEVTWRTFVGNTQNNPVAGIPSAGLPWFDTGGTVTVNLANGQVQFVINGLVLVGGNSSGTTGGVAMVVGTLVCNPGATDGQAIIDTPSVPLSGQGDAAFSGNLMSTPPATCNNPIFLIRSTTGSEPWFATAAVRL